MYNKIWLPLSAALCLASATTAQTIPAESSLPRVSHVVERPPAEPKAFDGEVMYPYEREGGPTSPPSGPDGTVVEGERMTFWVHGLGGNISAWGPVAGHIEDEYVTESKLLEYSDMQVMANADHVVQHVQDLLGVALATDPTSPVDRAIYIGHSLGGVVGRRMIHRHDQLPGRTQASFPFGGIATVATPHAGSEAAGARQEVVDLLVDGCQTVTAGPILDVVSDVPDLPALQLRIGPVVIAETRPFSAIEEAQEFVNTGCTNEFFELLTGTLVRGNFLPNVAEQIDFESPFINALNATRDPYNLPKVNITTIETPPVALRLFGSAIQNVQSVPLYGAEVDQQAIQLIEAQVADFRLAALALRNEADYVDGWHQKYTMQANGGVDIHGGSALRSPRQSRAARKRLAADGYDRGIDFLERLDNEWLAIQGARRTVPTGQTFFSCTCDYYEDQGDYMYSDTTRTDTREECEDTGSFEDVCQARFVVEMSEAFNIDTDGAATLESQEAWVNHETGRPVTRIPAFGNNHLQIRNSQETERVLEGLLFAGEAVDFFFLDERE